MPTPDNEDANRKSGIAYGAGLVLFSSVISFCGAGWLLDRWLGTKPWLLVIGIVLGAVAGFYQFIRLTSKL
ncbi:MAG: AtpZ/AtpI family protein [Acidobacteriota bacterium]|nr:AtpZ/AtpI family protein [Acidobacteriota bacterium]